MNSVKSNDIIIYANDFRRGTKKAFYNYCIARFKVERLENYHKNYDTARFFDMVNLIGGIAHAKTDKIKSWTEIENLLTGKVKIDNRTDEKIEKDVIEKYNKVFKIKAK